MLLRLTVLLVMLWSVDSAKNLRKQKQKIRKFHHSVSKDIQTPRVEKSSREMINPSRSWETFINLAQSGDDMDDGGGNLMGDLTAKSVGSKTLNTIEPIPGPRGPPGVPGVVVLEEWSNALKMLRETEGEIKRSKKGRYKAGGPVLNIVFNSDELLTKFKGNQSGGYIGRVRGFYSNLRSDIYLQRSSRMQISSFNRPRAASPFIFNDMLEFNHRSGSLVVPSDGAYMITATINLQLMDDEQPGFEDHITARICLNDDCKLWDLESYIPVLRTKYSTLHLAGTVRLEAGKSIHLFINNISPLDFKVLKSSGFSACLLSDN